MHTDKIKTFCKGCLKIVNKDKNMLEIVENLA